MLHLKTAGWSELLATNSLSVIEAAMPDWLTRQRWFGAKGRRIQSVRVSQWADLSVVAERAGPDRHLGESEVDLASEAILFVQVTYFEGEPDTYQIPLAIYVGNQADAIISERPESILTTLTSSNGSAVLHDATVREDFRQIELKLIERSFTLPVKCMKVPESHLSDLNGGGDTAPQESQSAEENLTPTATIKADASPAFRELEIRPALRSRVGSAEQSNTSILYGNDLILKLFRRLQPGQNPDVEIGRFLTEVAHFKNTPPFLGEITLVSASGEKTTIALLQGLVASEGDGWSWFLQQLKGFFGHVSLDSEAPIIPSPEMGSTTSPSVQMPKIGREAMAAAALLGRRTAEMHIALSSSSTDPAFAPEPCSQGDLETDSLQVESQIRSALEALKSRLSFLDDLSADDAGLVLSKRLHLLNRSRSITKLATDGKRIRIHGDYHLGQTLRTSDSEHAGDFVLLDFEGEPAKPLDQRRRKQSPLKDVAGMMRSFSYVAFAGLKQYQENAGKSTEASEMANLGKWALAWQNCASAEFLRVYEETIRKGPDLLPPSRDAQTLLDAFLLEKALYELQYEINNRPAWVHIPLAGILALCR
jgi:maltose alpha-D-glucosyltransferase/alpha-amylase